MRALLASALLTLAAAAAAAPASVDLSEQLTPGLRDQGGTASCHAFASVALLEAAIKRRGQGEQWLSSADLFVRVALKNGAYQILFLSDGNMTVTQKEDGKPDEDIEFALENGVAHGELVPWGVFHEKYAAYLKKRAAECGRLSREAKGKSCRFDSFKEYVERLEKDVDKREKEFIGASDKLVKDRAEVKAKLKGLSLHSKRRGTLRSFDDASLADIKDADVCREKGRKQTEALVETLAAGLPAVICFNMDNVPGWDKDTDKKSKSSHCVTAYGYTTAGEGKKARKSFQVRNSWGGVVFQAPAVNGVPQPPQVCPNTHDIDEDHACAIHGMHWLEP